MKLLTQKLLSEVEKNHDWQENGPRGESNRIRTDAVCRLCNLQWNHWFDQNTHVVTDVFHSAEGRTVTLIDAAKTCKGEWEPIDTKRTASQLRPVVRRELIIAEAERVAKRTASFLISTSNIDRATAYCVAKDAADAFGNALLRDLPENGVEVKP